MIGKEGCSMAPTVKVKTRENTLDKGTVGGSILERINTAIVQMSIGVVVMFAGLAGVWNLAWGCSAPPQKWQPKKA